MLIFIQHYNYPVRLHSAIGFVTPLDRLENRHLQIFADRDKKFESARQTCKLKRENTSEKQLKSHAQTGHSR